MPTILYMWTWIGFLIASIVLFIVHSSRDGDILLPYILILAGFPTFVSGFIIKFKPLIAGGICFWIIALIVNFAGPAICSSWYACSNAIRISYSGLYVKKQS